MEGLVVAGGIRRAEAESLRGHAHDREHRHRVHLHAADAIAHCMGVVVPVDIGHRQPVVEESEVEFAFLEHPADVPIVVRRPGVGARLRMTPGARKIRAILCLQESDQGHLAHGEPVENLSWAMFLRNVSLGNCSPAPDFASIGKSRATGELVFTSYRIGVRVAKRLPQARWSQRRNQRWTNGRNMPRPRTPVTAALVLNSGSRRYRGSTGSDEPKASVLCFSGCSERNRSSRCG